MTSKIQPMDLIIINNTDQPCTKLIAEVIEVDEAKNFVRARYLCKATNMEECYGRLSEATLVKDFGVQVFEEVKGKKRYIRSVVVGPSVATYRDGRPRSWQPLGNNPVQEMRVNKPNVIDSLVLDHKYVCGDDELTYVGRHGSDYAFRDVSDEVYIYTRSELKEMGVKPYDARYPVKTRQE